MAYQSLDQMLGTNLNGQLVLRLDANVDYYWLADAFQLAVYVQLMVLLDYFFAVVVEAVAVCAGDVAFLCGELRVFVDNPPCPWPSRTGLHSTLRARCCCSIHLQPRPRVTSARVADCVGSSV